MPLAGVMLLLAGGVWVVTRGPLRAGMATVLGFVLLVPDTQRLPLRGMDLLPVTRIVLLAFAARIAVDVAAGRIDKAVLRPNRVHLALAAFVGIVLTIGVGMAPTSVPLRPSLAVALQIVEQLLLFAVVVAVARTTPDLWWFARVLGVLLTGMCAIAAIEHMTGWSYGRWMLSGPGQQEGVLGARGLELRGTETRVRAAAQFSLAFAWVAAMITPVLVALASRGRRSWMWPATGLVAAAVVWSHTRSALPALALGVVVLVAASRFPRRQVLFTVVAVLIALAAYAGLPGLTDPFSSAQASASDIGRAERLDLLLDVAADRPLLGIGLGATQSVLDLTGADAGYVMTYAESGVLALVALLAAVAASLLTIAAGVRSLTGGDRSLAAACLAGATVGFAGAAAYDLFSVRGSSLVLWAIVALGVVAAERPDAPRSNRPSARALVTLPLAGAAVGLVLWAFAPVRSAASYVFETVPVRVAATATSDVSHVGEVVGETVCGQLEALLASDQIDMRCIARDGAAGVGTLRLEGESADAVDAAASHAVDAIRERHPGFALHVREAPHASRPTALRTAPVWLAAAALAAVLLAPLGARRRGPARDHAASGVRAEL